MSSTVSVLLTSAFLALASAAFAQDAPSRADIAEAAQKADEAREAAKPHEPTREEVFVGAEMKISACQTDAAAAHSLSADLMRQLIAANDTNAKLRKALAEAKAKPSDAPAEK